MALTPPLMCCDYRRAQPGPVPGRITFVTYVFELCPRRKKNRGRKGLVLQLRMLLAVEWTGWKPGEKRQCLTLRMSQFDPGWVP